MRRGAGRAPGEERRGRGWYQVLGAPSTGVLRASCGDWVPNSFGSGRESWCVGLDVINGEEESSFESLKLWTNFSRS